jgi:hypothetical protein
MNFLRAALFGSATLALGGGMAKADTIMASLFSPLAPVGSSTIDLDLSGIVAPSQTTIAGTGYTITFNGLASGQGVVQNTINPGHAVPVAGETGTEAPEYLTGGFGSSLTTNVANSGNYLSTGNVGTITISFATPQTSLALLWGSIDSSNSLSFNDVSAEVVTGTEVQAAAAGFVSNGFQGPGGSAYIVVDTATPFTTVTASSGVVSFEFAGIAAANAPFVSSNPEPSTLTLFASGLGIVPVFLFRNRKRNTLRNISPPRPN